MGHKINGTIANFSEFLNTSWPSIIPLLTNRIHSTNEDSINNWIQANWEILVEQKELPLNSYLEVYGPGADYKGASSRMIDCDAIATHKVTVLVEETVDLLNQIKVKTKTYSFDRLVGFSHSFYTENPPFNYVLVFDPIHSLERVFRMEDSIFKIEKL